MIPHANFEFRGTTLLSKVITYPNFYRPHAMSVIKMQQFP